jgi:acetyl esterase/lipase
VHFDRRRLLLASSALAALQAVAAEDEADPEEVLTLWPAQPPGATNVKVREVVVEREHPTGLRDRIARAVAKPIVTVFRPKRANGAAVLIVPGGGYRHVVIDKEGFETARWLRGRGFTALVLRYRLPGDGWTAGPDAPLQDAQRAIRVIRANAAKLGIDAKKVGVQGFSAGGHLAARLATEFATPVYESLDAADASSTRPDFVGLMYPIITMSDDLTHGSTRAQLLGPKPSEASVARFSAHLNVPRDAPPAFLMHATDDDAVPVENTLLMFDALRRAAVRTELHVFDRGGHGFGLRGIAGMTAAAWPELFRSWVARLGFVGGT